MTKAERDLMTAIGGTLAMFLHVMCDGIDEAKATAGQGGDAIPPEALKYLDRLSLGGNLQLSRLRQAFDAMALEGPPRGTGL